MTTLIFFGIVGLAFVCSMFVYDFYETKVVERLVPLYLEYDHHFRSRQERRKDEERYIAEMASGACSKGELENLERYIRVGRDAQHQELNNLTTPWLQMRDILLKARFASHSGVIKSLHSRLLNSDSVSFTVHLYSDYYDHEDNYSESLLWVLHRLFDALVIPKEKIYAEPTVDWGTDGN